MTKVYQIIVKPHQDFCFYNRNGTLTLWNDPKYPHIAGNSMYDGFLKEWKQINSCNKCDNKLHNIFCVLDNKNINTHYHATGKFICPSWYVNKQYYIEHVKEQLGVLLETSIQQFEEETFNIFVLKKDLKLKGENKGLLKISMCSQVNLKGGKYHAEFTQHCQKILDLKAFW